MHEFFHHLISSESRRALTRRELLEGAQKLLEPDECRHCNDSNFLVPPLVVVVGVGVGSFVWITTQVENFGNTQIDEGIAPHIEAMRALLGKNDFPVAITHTQ
ncbi:hypothetical protein D3C76_944850 [compost metagenome]